MSVSDEHNLRNAIIRKEIPENENPNKIVDIVKKIFDFNKQQKSKGIKILTNASKIANSTCTSKSRQYIWKSTKWNQANYIFFVSSKRNC